MVNICAGALFDNTENELRAAFSFELLSHNSRTARLKLSSETHVIDNDDSYAVGAAGQPHFTFYIRSLDW